MTYVVARPRGRFEIRESVHTAKGPRARSLANFARFTDEVLERARKRASRPFDAEAVRAAAERAAPGQTDAAPVPTAAGAATTVPPHARLETRRFVDASRRMARSLERVPHQADRRDPGDALIDLLEFVAQVTPIRRPRRESLRFPPLAGLRTARRRDAARVGRAP
jgi:hypothetical protein